MFRILLLPALVIFRAFSCSILIDQFPRFDLFGYDLSFDHALLAENAFGNRNQIFRELAGLALSRPKEDEDGVDFDRLRIAPKLEIHFENEAELFNKLTKLSSSSVCNFERSRALFPTAAKEAVSFEEKVALEAVLADLGRVIFPSLCGLPVGMEDLLLLLSAYFAFNFDCHYYAPEFSSLLELISLFAPRESVSICKRLLSDTNDDALLGDLVSFAVRNGCFFTLWWALESKLVNWSELEEDVRDLVLCILNQSQVKRIFPLKRLLQEFNESFLIHHDSLVAPLPLLWFIAVKASGESELEPSPLLNEILADRTFDWNISDFNGLTILGRWLAGPDEKNIPQILISKLLRLNLITENLVASGFVRLGFVKAIGMISEQEQRFEIKKLSLFMLESREIDWELAVSDALECGQLWLFFRLLDDAVGRRMLDKEFLETQVIEPLVLESLLPGDLSKLFEKSHKALLKLPSWPANLPEYHKNWKVASEAVPESPRSTISLSLGFSRSRSRSKANTTPNLASNVLSSVLDIFERREQHSSLVQKYRQTSATA